MMPEYQPGNDRRGTCPHCDRRCRVTAKRPRIVGHHYEPGRPNLGARVKCSGVGEVCREDRDAR